MELLDLDESELQVSKQYIYIQNRILIFILKEKCCS